MTEFEEQNFSFVRRCIASTDRCEYSAASFDVFTHYFHAYIDLGTLIETNIALFNACPQKEIGSSVQLIINLTMSNNVRFLRSDTPFNYGVPKGVPCERIPYSFK